MPAPRKKTPKPAMKGATKAPPKGAAKPGVLARLARRWLRRLLLTLLTAYAGLFAFGLLAADYLIFPALAPSYQVTEPDLTMIPMPGGGRIATLWLPKTNAAHAILYLHGNGEDLGRIRRRLEFIRAYTDCSILAIDYPGYGRSPGSPSESGCLRAADAAFEHLSRLRGYAPDNIVVWGYSLGTGPAVHLAAHRRVHGVVLDAPFTSAFRTVVPWKLLPFDRFDNLALIDRVQSPLLIAHGDRDRTIPFAHGETLHRRATAAPVNRFLRLASTGHIDFPGVHGDAYRREVMALIDGPPAGPNMAILKTSPGRAVLCCEGGSN